ncbi:MAG TPA: hypothetical protein VM661_17085 [Candidatus Sulfotelmatobacter sp.]|jgi:hypothetical protein|nr:hypothetical protein [Candidatus Sulfotelmatobacter sp.]
MSFLRSPVPSSRTHPHRVSIGLAPLLVWVYRDQKADKMSGRGLWAPEAEADAAPGVQVVRRWSGCGCAQLEAIALLGSRIDATGWQQRPVLHPDAEVLHDRLVEMSREDWMGALLLRRYGGDGGMPDWGDGDQELGPVFDARDKIVQDHSDEMVEVVDAVGRNLLVPVRYCPLEAYPSDDWVALTRGEYRQWFAALERLWARLDGLAFSRWRLDGLGAEAEPWMVKK